jgi:hypothetical protein
MPTGSVTLGDAYDPGERALTRSFCVAQGIIAARR